MKENKLKGRVNPDAEINGSFEESSGALVRRSSNVIFGSNLEENEANGTVKPETEVDRNTSMTTLRNFELIQSMVENVHEKLGSEGFRAANAEVKLGSEGFGAANAEVKLGSEEFKAAKAKVADSSEVSEDDRARRRENKELSNGSGGSDSKAYPRSMGPSNELEVAAIPTHSQPEAPLGPSVYYAEDEGSESNVFLDGGGESIDYESQKTEFEKSDRVIQTTIEIKNNQKWTNTEGNWQRNCMELESSMGTYITRSFITEEISHIEKTEKGKNVLIDPHTYSEIGSAATVRNGELTINDVEKAGSEGIKQHQNGNSVSEFILKDSQHRFLSAQDETQPEDRTRILEKSSLEGKVEDIVKILKEQQSHDLLCPVCGSCITKRVILRKRKRVQEVNDDEQGPVSEEEHEVTEAQNKQPISNEDSEESEAYGCLACFSLFFRRVPGVKLSQAKSQSSNNSLIEEHPSENVKNSRDLVDRERESIYCLQFLYPWGHSVNRESNAAGIRADFAAESSQQKTLKEAESRLQIKHSASSLGIADTLQQRKAHSEASANVVTESILIHEGKGDTMINKVHQNEDNTDMEDGKLDSIKTEQLSGIETINALGMSPPKEIESSMHEDGSRPCGVTEDQVSNKSSAAEGEEELTISEQQQDSLKETKAVRQNESYSKDYLCSCILVSLPAWSLWSTKKSITDQELKEPLLPNIKDKETFDKAPVPSKDDSERELILPLKPDSVDSTSSSEKQDPSTLAQSKVDDSVPHRSEISSDSGKTVISTQDRLETIVEVQQTDDLQPSNVITTVSQLTSTSTQVQGPNVVTEWDLLKSIVYGGLVVSITSLGVVSSAAGGKAKTLIVVAIALANLLSGLLLIVNNILDLHHYHRDQFKETIGHRFWFNGFVAIISYLVFGSLAPITYCFSFQRSDDKLYKFLATSLVSLVSIISLALGKARVTNKSYIRITTLYVVTGFWASIIGFFAGEYIKKLLAKWGLTTD